MCHVYLYVKVQTSSESMCVCVRESGSVCLVVVWHEQKTLSYEGVF